MIQTYPEIIQGTEAWHQLRCGCITASTMDLILTPTLKIAANDKERSHMYELLGQRITNYVEPQYVSSDMLRGEEEEIDARRLYAKIYGDVDQVGYITNDELGFKIGFSPDGLVGEDGLIEIKSRRQKWQIETLVKNEVPTDYMLQIQTGLYVSDRQWCDFISYCGGLPMFVKRVERIPEYIEAIKIASTSFENRLNLALAAYNKNTISLHPTERRIEVEMHM